MGASGRPCPPSCCHESDRSRAGQSCRRRAAALRETAIHSHSIRLRRTTAHSPSRLLEAAEALALASLGPARPGRPPVPQHRARCSTAISPIAATFVQHLSTSRSVLRTGPLCECPTTKLDGRRDAALRWRLWHRRGWGQVLFSHACGACPGRAECLSSHESFLLVWTAPPVRRPGSQR